MSSLSWSPPSQSLVNQLDFTSHQFLLIPPPLILTSVLYCSDYRSNLLRCLPAASPTLFTPLQSEGCFSNKNICERCCLLAILQWLHHWVQDGLQTSSCDLHTVFFSSLHFFFHPLQFFRSHLWISSSGMPPYFLELRFGALLWAPWYPVFPRTQHLTHWFEVYICVSLPSTRL